MNFQGWFPLGLTGWSPCCPRDSQESSLAPQFKSISSLALNLLYGPTLTSVYDYCKNIALTIWTFVGIVMSLLFNTLSSFAGASQVVVKNPPCNAGEVRNAGLILGLGRSPGEGHGNPFQYSGLENSMDRGAWQATVHGVAKSQTWLSNFHSHFQPSSWSSSHIHTWLLEKSIVC